jgi:hypothetical protein
VKRLFAGETAFPDSCARSADCPNPQRKAGTYDSPAFLRNPAGEPDYFYSGTTRFCRARCSSHCGVIGW